MLSRKLLGLLRALLLLALVFSFVGFAQNKEEQDIRLQESLPKGNWSVSFHPYLRPDYLNAPVIILSVTNRRLAVEKFEIKNISDKPVKGIKVRWILYENENQSRVLREGQTALLNFRDELPSGRKGFIRLRLISFFDFYRDFLERGQLNRNFDVDLRIDEVRFADGSVWRWEDGAYPRSNLDRRKNDSKETFEIVIQDS